ncbi:MAG: MraY family glycosyltransferase [Candidatus Moranbacteria bacterium]|nr:MraY family glycosyltransferase [Candidatus Moranbacteria bacterium]
MTISWLIYFLIAFLISSFLSWGLSKLSRAKGRKNAFYWRLGGLAIIASFVVGVLLNSEIVITQKISAILISAGAIAAFGLLDDKFEFSWKVQLPFQALLALALVWFGFEVNAVSFAGEEFFRMDYLQVEFLGAAFSLVSGFFILIWLASIINAVNWLDGTDGLLSAVAALALAAIFFVSLRPEVNQPALSIISLIAIGSILGFFIFNFPPAKIIAGTSGSYFVGMLLAALAIIAGTKIATTMVILILPVADFLWVTVERIKRGKSIFEKEEKKTHLHYKLLNAGWSEKQVLFGYFCFLGAALLASLFVASQLHKLILLAAELAMIMIVIFSLTRINEKREKKN